jgi:hypothetical protein
VQIGLKELLFDAKIAAAAWSVDRFQVVAARYAGSFQAASVCTAADNQEAAGRNTATIGAPAASTLYEEASAFCSQSYTACCFLTRSPQHV